MMKIEGFSLTTRDRYIMQSNILMPRQKVKNCGADILSV
jgi:hypothetical protein